MVHLRGDTHGVWKDLKESLLTLNDGDTLIILGDFGFIFYNKETKWRSKFMRDEKHLKKASELCKEKNITLLFIDGNHENFQRLNNDYETVDYKGGKAHFIKDNIYHLKRGEVFIIEGKKYLAFGGANSVDRANRIAYTDWWKEEEPSVEDKANLKVNLDRHRWKVDYILTHTIFTELMMMLDEDKYKYKNDFEAIFQDIKFDTDFDTWFFGHFHENKKLGKYHCLLNEIVKIENKGEKDEV